MSMELRQFVSESLKQIIDGVNEAKSYAEQNGAMVNPIRWSWNSSNVQVKYEPKSGAAIETVEFDVVVTAIEGTETKSGIGVFIGAVNLGSQGASQNQSSSVSRLKFSVPLVLPSSRSS